MQVAPLSHFSPTLFKGEAVKFLLECMQDAFRASPAQPGTFFYFPSTQLLFQSPNNTLLNVNGLASINFAKHSSLNTLLSLSGLQAQHGCCGNKDQQVHPFCFFFFIIIHVCSTFLA